MGYYGYQKIGLYNRISYFYENLQAHILYRLIIINRLHFLQTLTDLTLAIIDFCN